MERTAWNVYFELLAPSCAQLCLSSKSAVIKAQRLKCLHSVWSTLFCLTMLSSRAYQHVHLQTVTHSVVSGLQRYREASLVAAEGLKLDPFNLELKKMSEEATRGTLKDLLTGVICKAYLLSHIAFLKASPAAPAFFSVVCFAMTCMMAVCAALLTALHVGLTSTGTQSLHASCLES